MTRVLSSVPIVGGLAFREVLAQAPREFTATLKPEPDNPYNPRALAVHGPAGKLGYVSPEIARDYYEHVKAAGQVSCPARVVPHASRATGVEGYLDFSGLETKPPA